MRMLDSTYVRACFMAAGLCLGSACSSSDGGGAADPSTTPDGGVTPPDGGVKPPEDCKATGEPDRPDALHQDTNCDGIDGDRTNAVFVATAGSDSASGSLEAPVKTLKRALELASATEKDVYVCNGTYPENVLIQTNGIGVYGGFDCTQAWSRTQNGATVAPLSGKALEIRGAKQVTIENLDFKAASATQPGSSSIAAVVSDSQDVVIKNGRLQAGNGAKGKNGDAAPSSGAAPAKAKDGQSAPAGLVCDVYIAGDPENICNQQLHGVVEEEKNITCNGQAITVMPGWGGFGANLATKDPQQTRGGDGFLNRAPTGGKGGIAAKGTSNYFPLVPAPGSAGQPGLSGQSGLGGTSNFGTILNGNYVATNSGADGTPGAPGMPGGGGSGGGCLIPTVNGVENAVWFLGGGGGQGGFPGCGGAAGRGGAGGGASIALLSVSSSVTLDSVVIATGNGGAGGDPSAGADGQPGGTAGQGGRGMPPTGNYATLLPPGGTVDGQPGGKGGAGGKGGPGGPGGGGPSIGIVVVGDAPTKKDLKPELGHGGNPGNSIAGSNTAQPGLAQLELVVSATP